MNNTKEKYSESQVQSILNAIHTITGGGQILRKWNNELSFINPDDLPTQKNCPFSVPVNLVENPYKPRLGKRIKPCGKYKYFFKEARRGRISDKIIQETAKKWVKNLPVIALKQADGWHFMEGNAKSSARYNKRNYWKIHDHAKALKEQGRKPYFLTVTNDPKRYNNNYINAWKGFKKNLQKMLRTLARKYDMKYECVCEAQYSGNPHAHIVLWTEYYCSSDKIRHYKQKTYISGGELKATLKKYEPLLGFTELRRGEDKDPINYLLKYISKATTRDFYKTAKNTSGLKKEERKDLLSALMPVVSQVRQFSMSEGVLKKEEEKEIVEVNAKKESEGMKEFDDASAASDYLKKLCINLPLSCACSARFLSYKTATKDLPVQISQLNELSEEKRGSIAQQGKCVGCNGCIITHFLNYLENGSDEWFDKNPKQIFEERDIYEGYSGILADEETEEETSGIDFDPVEIETSKKKERKLTVEQIQEEKELIMLLNLRKETDMRGFSLYNPLEKFSINSKLGKTLKKEIPSFYCKGLGK